MISLHALDRRINDIDIRPTEFRDAAADALDRLLACFRITNDTALADILPSCLELRLDKDDSRSSPRLHVGVSAHSARPAAPALRR